MLRFILGRCLFIVAYALVSLKGQNHGSHILETNDFSKVVHLPTYVDKTLLIKELITNNKTSVITAPPMFGKSANLDMIKTFLEIEVNTDGIKKTKSDYLTEPVKDTENYKLFNENNLRICQEDAIMNDMLGRTPVLSVSFKSEKIIQFESDVLLYFQEVVHQTFKKYGYLSKSDALDKKQKQNLDKWYNEEDYQKCDLQQVISALRDLSEYLYLHFRKRVFVLIDDHDYAVRSVMFSAVDDRILSTVIDLSARMMNSLLKKNSKFVQGGMMTGVLDVPAVGIPAHNTKDSDSFHVYRFLDDHSFGSFYGLTKDEVEDLIRNNNLKENIEDVTNKYNGFLRKRRDRIFNLYSVLSFITTDQLNTYWTKRNPIPYLVNLIQIPYIKGNISEIVKNESVYIDAIEKTTMKEFEHMKNATTNRNFKLSDISRVFFFLLAEGCLTYKTGIVIKIDKETPKIGVRCPNDEIKQYFEEALKYQLTDC